ncbi:MAG: hypoxanthine phosphoribosyltransferase [Anaerolineae bacterium]|nr:hypoxanthine phosphoribosyltransferase [Anaerolineae bacterium]
MSGVPTHDVDESVRVVLAEEEIARRVRELGAQIAADYSGLEPVLVGVMKGMFIFMADLVRAVPVPLVVDFMAISRYGPTAKTKGVVRIVKDLDVSITGRHVLFVEDIIDTGMTLNYILRTLSARRPASLKVCALVDMPRRRFIDLPIAYRGFTLEEGFLVGYGLDYREKYRNLPYLGLLNDGSDRPSGGGAP